MHILVAEYIPKDWFDDVLKRINIDFPFIIYVDIKNFKTPKYTKQNKFRTGIFYDKKSLKIVLRQQLKRLVYDN